EGHLLAAAHSVQAVRRRPETGGGAGVTSRPKAMPAPTPGGRAGWAGPYCGEKASSYAGFPRPQPRQTFCPALGTGERLLKDRAGVTGAGPKTGKHCEQLLTTFSAFGRRHQEPIGKKMMPEIGLFGAWHLSCPCEPRHAARCTEERESLRRSFVCR